MHLVSQDAQDHLHSTIADLEDALESISSQLSSQDHIVLLDGSPLTFIVHPETRSVSHPRLSAAHTCMRFSERDAKAVAHHVETEFPGRSISTQHIEKALQDEIARQSAQLELLQMTGAVMSRPREAA